MKYKETIKRLVVIIEKQEKTLGLEGTDRICRRISNDNGNGPTKVDPLVKLKSAHEISLTFSLCLNIGVAFWLVYGILNGLMSVIIWNGIALALGCGMFYAKMKLGR